MIRFWRFFEQTEHELLFRSFLASIRAGEERCFNFAFENSRNINLQYFTADTYGLVSIILWSVSSLVLLNKNLQCVEPWTDVFCLSINNIITLASRSTYNALDFCANLSLVAHIKFFLFKVGCTVFCNFTVKWQRKGFNRRVKPNNNKTINFLKFV